MEIKMEEKLENRVEKTHLNVRWHRYKEIEKEVIFVEEYCNYLHETDGTEESYPAWKIRMRESGELPG
jgi:hypothetical protein